ncbi:MAG TPA: murein L,D-transpeptidase catalytic domain family protein [Thermoanaerobaculia bacterium]|nr:murein L,D-transpeptidase catalytic domain family protein [Thermoanaerobaculia bacterium]
MKRIAASIAFVFLFVAAGKARAAEDLSPLVQQAPGLKADVLRLAMNAAKKAEDAGLVQRRDLLTVIDYSIPSSQPRLFVFDLASKKLLFRELVAHGKNSGGDVTTAFSNSPGSLETSLGLFVTADTYTGHNGYSLRLKGLEEGFNDMALDRAIVLHGAAYVSYEAVKVLGRLGRSWGCPAVSSLVSKKIIDTIRGGSAVFAYYPDKAWLTTSAFLH